MTLRRHATAALLTAIVSLLLFSGVACRGDLSEDPPIHFNPNMDNQQRWDPQEPDQLKGRTQAMLRIPKGTVAVGHLKNDDHLHRGRLPTGFASSLPPGIPLTRELLVRGRMRFNIYCAGCHSRIGDGQGYVYKVQAGLPRPASFQDRRLLAMPLGEVVHTITFGKSNMQALGFMIPAHDRWAIAAYIRALQLSQNADRAKAGR